MRLKNFDWVQCFHQLESKSENDKIFVERNYYVLSAKIIGLLDNVFNYDNGVRIRIS